MGANLAEFLFAELLLLLVSSILALVGYMLKRHVNATDALALEVKEQGKQVARLLERDRMQRLADYGSANQNADGE